MAERIPMSTRHIAAIAALASAVCGCGRVDVDGLTERGTFFHDIEARGTLRTRTSDIGHSIQHWAIAAMPMWGGEFADVSGPGGTTAVSGDLDSVLGRVEAGLSWKTERDLPSQFGFSAGASAISHTLTYQSGTTLEHARSEGFAPHVGAFLRIGLIRMGYVRVEFRTGGAEGFRFSSGSLLIEGEPTPRLRIHTGWRWLECHNGGGDITMQSTLSGPTGGVTFVF